MSLLGKYITSRMSARKLTEFDIATGLMTLFTMSNIGPDVGASKELYRLMGGSCATLYAIRRAYGILKKQ